MTEIAPNSIQYEGVNFEKPEGLMRSRFDASQCHDKQVLLHSRKVKLFHSSGCLLKSLSAKQTLTTKLVVFGNGWNHETVSKHLHKDRFFEIALSHELPIGTAYNLIASSRLMKKRRTVDVSEDSVDIQDAINDSALIHFQRSFLFKPWVRGCTHPSREL